MVPDIPGTTAGHDAGNEKQTNDDTHTPDAPFSGPENENDGSGHNDRILRSWRESRLSEPTTQSGDRGASEQTTPKTPKKGRTCDQEIEKAIAYNARAARLWNLGYSAFCDALQQCKHPEIPPDTPAKVPIEAQDMADEFAAGWLCARRNHITYGQRVKAGYRWVTSSVYRKAVAIVEQTRLFS
jgi:hypothetical protein